MTPNLASLAANWFQPPVAEEEEEEEAPRAPFEAPASSEPMSATSSSGTHFSSWRPERLKCFRYHLFVFFFRLVRERGAGGGGG